jgi:sugar phosphate permease
MPGTIPWGFINVFLNQFIAEDKGFGSEIATVCITCFGVGCVFGVIAGGAIGQYIYNRSRTAFCVYLGIFTAAGMPVIWMIVLMDYGQAGLLSLAFLLGLVSSITGPNVRVVIINCNTPETRGTAFSFFNLADDVGKGLGPYIVSLLVASMAERSTAFAVAALFWGGASVFHFVLCCFLRRDEDQMILRFSKAIVLDKNEGRTESEMSATYHRPTSNSISKVSPTPGDVSPPLPKIKTDANLLSPHESMASPGRDA